MFGKKIKKKPHPLIDLRRNMPEKQVIFFCSALSVIGQEVRSEGTRPHRHNCQGSYKVGDHV